MDVNQMPRINSLSDEERDILNSRVFSQLNSKFPNGYSDLQYNSAINSEREKKWKEDFIIWHNETIQKAKKKRIQLSYLPLFFLILIAYWVVALLIISSVYDRWYEESPLNYATLAISLLFISAYFFLGFIPMLEKWYKAKGE